MNAFELVLGNFDSAASGRSIGGLLLKPKLSAPASMVSWPITSAPIVANAELHDSRRMSNSAPPHVSPPKFWIGWPSGGSYCVAGGKFGLSGVTLPLCSPIEPVTTLNVEP